MAVVALELTTFELVHRLPPLSHILGRVTLDLASAMTETHLLPPSSRNSESTTVLRVPPHGPARNQVHRRHLEPSPALCSLAQSPGWSIHPRQSVPYPEIASVPPQTSAVRHGRR